MKKFALLFLLLVPALGAFAEDIASPIANDSSAYVIENPNYKTCYSDRYGQPLWSFYKLNSSMIVSGTITEEYKLDNRVKNNKITPKEMASSPFEKVQLFPATHAGSNPTVQKSTFLTTNVVLMSKQLADTTWARITKDIEDISRNSGNVYVISGPVFDKETAKIKYMLGNKCAIPAFFYRIVLYYEGGSPVYKCWKFTNRIPSDYERTCDLDTYRYNLYQLEAETGIDFFDSAVDNAFRKDKMKYLEKHIK